MALGLLAGCAAYHPKPLDPAATARQLQARSLSDPGLAAYAESAGASAAWPPLRWDFASLLKAALYFSPGLSRAQAEAATARASAYAAGLHQDPGLSVALEHRVGDLQGVPRSTWGPALDIPLTMWGKRGIRQAEAGARLRDSEYLLVRTAWHVRAALKDALVASQEAEVRLWIAGALAASRKEVLSLTEARLAAGEVSAPEAELARSEAQAARLALAKAQEAQAAARSALSRALGVPEGALGGITLPELEESLPEPPAEAKAQEVALTGRSDLLAALSAYAASDQALRLAVREQYPDLRLSPGYLWDQGTSAWVIGAASLLPLVNRNRGEIAKAEAARNAEGQKALALQQQILHDAEAASAAYDAARRSLHEARGRELSRRASLDFAEKAFAAGEEDALSVALARAGLESARLDTLDAHQSALLALGHLEEALEAPILPADPLPPLPGDDAAKKENPS